jgi:hypothetical protein
LKRPLENYYRTNNHFRHKQIDTISKNSPKYQERDLPYGLGEAKLSLRAKDPRMGRTRRVKIDTISKNSQKK